MHQRTITILRISLGAVFLWFGLLKLFNVSPVFDVIANAYPGIAQNPITFAALAIGEVLMGIGFFIKRFSRYAAAVAVAHLAIATIGVLRAPGAFLPNFPLLTLVGEFVVKNIVLISASLVVVTAPPSPLPAKVLYTCEVCGLNYLEKSWVEKCEAWCKEHKSCNLEIITHAVK